MWYDKSIVVRKTRRLNPLLTKRVNSASRVGFCFAKQRRKRPLLVRGLAFSFGKQGGLYEK